MNRRGGLGKGLAALIPPDAGGGAPPADAGAPAQASATLRDLQISAIVANPQQPRQVFDDDELEGLAISIADLGVLQPIVVRPTANADQFELVAGERRLRASDLAGLDTIPAIIRQTEDGDLLKEALVENIHRVQLNPLEEAAAYQQLLEDFGFTQEELAKRLGKSRPAISNALRLLGLPSSVQRKVAAGILTAGHAKALLALEHRSQQESVADRVIAEGLSVRATEEMVRLKLMDAPPLPTTSVAGATPSAGVRTRLTAPALVELQQQLSEALMARVKIGMGKRTGKIAITFRSIGDLERLVGTITAGIEAEAAAGDAAATQPKETSAEVIALDPAPVEASEPAQAAERDLAQPAHA